jgi:DNA-binding response OmpR family regulator
MPTITVTLSPSLDAALKQKAASCGRSIENVVNSALSQHLGWKDFDSSSSMLRIGNLELDPARRILRKNALPVHLTPKEFELVHYLMVHAGFPMAHARLLGTIWGVEYRSELEYLRIYIRQLRKKLEDDPAKPKYLLTEPWYGYRFADAKDFCDSLTIAEEAASFTISQNN